MMKIYVYYGLFYDSVFFPYIFMCSLFRFHLIFGDQQLALVCKNFLKKTIIVY